MRGISLGMFAILLLSGCMKSAGIPEVCAPETVQGRDICFTSADGISCSFLFRKGNASRLGDDIPPAYGNSVRYAKTGVDSASVVVEAWEFVYTYTLHFTSPTTGVATERGYGEGMKWEKSGIRFQIK